MQTIVIWSRPKNLQTINIYVCIKILIYVYIYIYKYIYSFLWETTSIIHFLVRSWPINYSHDDWYHVDKTIASILIKNALNCYTESFITYHNNLSYNTFDTLLLWFENISARITLKNIVLENFKFFYIFLYIRFYICKQRYMYGLND